MQGVAVGAAALLLSACDTAARTNQPLPAARLAPDAPAKRPRLRGVTPKNALATAAVPSPFQLVAKGSFSLHALADRVWLSAGEDGLAFTELRGSRWVRDETLAYGAQRCTPWNQLAMAATHAHELWLFDDFHAWSACPPPARLYRRQHGGPWKLQGMLRAHWIGVGPWLGTSTLIAEVPLRSGPPWGYTLRATGGARAPVPRQWSRAPKAGGCWTELEYPRALFSNTAGEALVVGVARCTPPPDAPADEALTEPDLAVAERFDKNGTSTRVSLPVALESNSAVIGHGPHAVWAIGTDAQDRTALVAAKDRRFEIIDFVPAQTALLDVDPQGNVWTLQEAALVRRSAGGEWQHVVMPVPGESVLGLHAGSPEDVWLVLESGVYRTLPMEPISAAPRACSDEEAARFAAAAHGAAQRTARIDPSRQGCRSAGSGL